jgi:hypothetical protein
MNPLVVIVLEILAQDVAQLVFRREDEVIEAFLFDGPDEPFRMSVEIRTSWWQFHWLYTCCSFKALTCSLR